MSKTNQLTFISKFSKLTDHTINNYFFEGYICQFVFKTTLI
ncbi:hypothetical protein HMPREF0496_1034 [Lentilactobacillus hilgardii ATCC 27305]|nr:hypothetical protein HMPREF0496_1034 [Lentilactobacillus hilgardii ATCC 27305]